MKWFRLTYIHKYRTTMEELSSAPSVGRPSAVFRAVRTTGYVGPWPLSDWAVTDLRGHTPAGENPGIFYPIGARDGLIEEREHINGTTQIHLGSQEPSSEATLISVDGPDLGRVGVGDRGGYSYEGGNAIRFTEPIPLLDKYIITVYGGVPQFLPNFWTNFRKCHETAESEGPPQGATVVPGLPYSITLPAITASDKLLFEVTLGAGTYRFHTTDSPHPTEHDTHIALFNAAGAMLAQNDDIDVDGGDYRSNITKTLSAGTYYIMLTAFGTAFDNGFGAVLDGNEVAAGTIFKVDAV